jgi:hypothetical protein
MLETCEVEYRCPGENYAISRAVHLGRLAGFYPACRDCPRREDTAGLSSRHVRQLAEVAVRNQRPKLFRAEGVGCRTINELDLPQARRIAIEYAARLASRPLETGVPTKVIVSGDGRLATAEILAAIVEGLRWTGGEVIDIGPATAPCTAKTMEHLAADGAVFVGRADGGQHSVGLKFWAQGEPLSQGGLLDEVAAALQTGACSTETDRPSRRLGSLRRFAATESYLNDFRPAYHALRPLRFVFDCPLEPLCNYLHALMNHVACRIIPAETAGRKIGPQVVTLQAHFGIQIGDDGENCCLWDDRGRTVETGKMLAFLSGKSTGPIGVADGLRQQTFRQMRQSGISIAADAVGRLWYAGQLESGLFAGSPGHKPEAQAKQNTTFPSLARQACIPSDRLKPELQPPELQPLPDALQTLTLLLVLLSRDDAAFSDVLDRTATAG